MCIRFITFTKVIVWPWFKAFVSFILFYTIKVTFLQSFDHSYNQKITKGHAFSSICKSVINFMIFDAVDGCYLFHFLLCFISSFELCIWPMLVSLLIITGTWRTQALYILLLSYWFWNVLLPNGILYSAFLFYLRLITFHSDLFL